MKRSAAWFFSLLVFTTACNKPSDEACRKAIRNMRDLLGTESAATNSDFEGNVRRCKGGSKKKSVECAGNAKTLDDLRKCEFMKIPARAGTGDGTAAGTGAGTSSGTAAGTGDGTAAGTGTGDGTAAGTGAGTSSGAAGTGAAPGSGS